MKTSIDFTEDYIYVNGVLIALDFAVARAGLGIVGEAVSRGNGAGFSFADRNKHENFGDTRGERYVWYCEDENARLWSGGDLLTVRWSAGVPTLAMDNGHIHGNRISANNLESLGGEVVSRGNMAGFSFADRTRPVNVQGSGNDKGDRYVWYCDEGSARLWSGGDMMTVSWKDRAQAGGINPANARRLKATNSRQIIAKIVSVELPPFGQFSADVIKAKALALDGINDVSALLVSLQARITALEKQVAALKA